MRGAALHFHHIVGRLTRYDGLMVTDLMSLSDFKALAGPDKCPPVIAYFHENQITYPKVPGKSNDFHFGIIDITTALSADRNLFNSKVHMHDFLSGIKDFIARVPDFQPLWIHDAIAGKSDCLYPGVELPETVNPHEKDPLQPPLIIWNHRWGYDKNPGAFFAALDKALANGHDFRLAVLGDDSAVNQKVFSRAKTRYKDRIVQFGYVGDRNEYIEWLKKGDIVISTARQENFGISVVEAVRYGCLPLLPNRLSYPEILPHRFHEDFIYRNPGDMDHKLARMLVNRHQYTAKQQELSESMGRFAWKNMIRYYDSEFERLLSL